MRPFVCERCGAGFDGDAGWACPFCVRAAEVASAADLRVSGAQVVLEQRLGRGRSTEVFAATWCADGGTPVPVAVKRVRADQHADVLARARLRREAAHLERGVPGVLSLLAVLHDAEGEPSALVLPRYARSLGAPHGPSGESAVPPSATALGHAVAAALAGLHDLGVIHRDLHPGNVLFGPRTPMAVPPPHIFLADLGHARAPSDAPCTPEGHAVGTRGYVAPEVLEGAEATTASDVYALGVILFEQLAGERPFAHPDPAQELERALHERPFPLRSYRSAEGHPLRLLVLVDRMVARSPAERPDAALVRDELSAGALRAPGAPR